MSKRYPPIYSIVAIIVLVTVAAANTNGAALYVANTIAKTLDALISNIANYLDFVFTDGFAIVVSFVNKYAVVIILAIYCKTLFSKRAKEVHNTIKQTLKDYENGRGSQSEANLTLYLWAMWFYIATACVIGLIIKNIIIPNL